ncbi:MAG: FAD-dependent monooxygenase [Hyphomicrobiaceae bacterium]
MNSDAVPAFDIVVVGASHVGLAMALALAGTLGSDLRLGLIERRDLTHGPVPTADPRAFALSAGSVALLTALGVWPALAPHAEAVTGIDITDSSLEHAVRPTLLSYDNQISGGRPATFIVEADRLAAALLARVRDAPGITVMAKASIAPGTTLDGAGAHVQLADGRRLTARLLIAADGARSMIRDLAAIKTVAWAYPQTGIVTVVTHERPHEGRAVQHFLPAGPFAILPLPGRRSCITWTEDAAAAAHILSLDDSGFLAEIERRFGYRLGIVNLAGPRASWPLELQLARSLVAPRVALIGDAARSVHPIAGQGLNLGFRDVAALTEVTADMMRLGLDPGDAMGLERYQSWRRFDGQSSAAAYDALNRLFSNDLSLVRAVRDVGLGIVDRLPGLKQLLVEEAAGRTGDVPRLLQGAFP